METGLTKKQNIVQVIKFVLFSASAGIIQIVSFALCFEVFHLPNRLSYFLALTLSVLYNFTLNREFTFKSSANVPRAMLLVALYYAIFTPLSTWWVDPLVNLGLNEYVVLLGTMVVNLATEFINYRFIIYRKSINTNKRATIPKAKIIQ
ncbi:MAG: GtrA family protein [Sphaerochaetaceae bacterium]|nr:GtrA family protein [Sphaerochaetaceae bacterium]